MEKRDTIAGCDVNDKAAQALGRVLEIFSKGRRFVENGLSGCRGIVWKPAKGGWVVHNTAWALWGGMPRNIWKAAVETLRLEDPTVDTEEAIRDVVVRSHFAGKGQTDLVRGVVLEDGTAFQFSPRPRDEEGGMKIGESVLTDGRSIKIVAYL